MREVPVEGWIKQGGSVWTGRGGGFSAVSIGSEASELQTDTGVKNSYVKIYDIEAF